MRHPVLRPRSLALGLVVGVVVTLACDEYLTDLDPAELAPPTLTGFAVTPDSLDLSTDDATVLARVSGRAGGGIDSVRVALAGPQDGTVTCVAVAPAAGSMEDGAWECGLELGAAPPLGVWAVERVTLHYGGPAVELAGTDLVEAGFGGQVRVARSREILVPELASLALTPDTVDVTGGDASLLVRAGLAAGAPADSVDIDLAGERQDTSCTAYPDGEESPTYECVMAVPVAAAPDSWQVERVRLFGADTTVALGAAELETLGLPTAVAVVIDRTDLLALALVPDTVHLPDTTGIQAEVTVRNSRRPVDSVRVALRGPDDGATACVAVSSSAAFRDISAWDCTLNLPEEAAGGTWSVEELRVFLAGRAPDAFATDTLRALGLAVDLTAVEAEDLSEAGILAPADGSTLVAGDTVVFQGTGRDRDGAELAGAALAWSSSLDGDLGTGASVTRTDLSVGSHTVTLTATGPAGGLATASVELVIEAFVPPTVPDPTGVLAYSGGGSIRTVHADGTNPMNTGRAGITPRWSPDGGRIVYESSGNRISVMNSDGSNNRRLTDYRSHAPTWSADMTEVATQATPDGASAYVIMAIDPVSGDSVRRITNTADSDQHPHWSSSGDQIVVIRNGNVTVIRASDGAVLHSLPGVLAWNPSWSPDERRVVFHQRTGENAPRIAILDLETGEVTGLHEEEGVAVGAPAWSPDGHWIAFGRRPDGTNNSEIWLRRADGYGDPIQLTTDGLNNARPDWTAEVTTPVDPPSASIEAPADGATFTEGASVVFQGAGTGGTGQPLSGGDLVWTSSRDGQIGTGQGFARADLSVGAHTITLRVTDPGTGLSDQASIALTVEEAVSTGPVEWVAAGDGGGAIMTSTDGTTWTTRPSPLGRGRAVARSGDLWVVTGDVSASDGTTTLVTSTDGVTWTARPTPFQNTGFAVAWNGQHWLAGAAASGAGSTLVRSTDGISWSTPGVTPFTIATLGLASNGSMWVAVGAGGRGTGTTVARSPDGISWTASESPFGTSTSIETAGWAVAWNGEVWLVGGAGATALATSEDGVSWTLRSSPLTSAYDVAWNGTLWVAAGSGSAALATSTDGATWTARSSPFTSARGVAWDGQQWIATGSGSATVATSPDGITWTPRSAPLSTTWQVASTAVVLYPSAAIQSPSDGETFASGASVIFQGAATSPAGQTLTGGDLVWTSSLDGQIGTGQSFALADLSDGVHAIALWATDPATGTATRTSVTVTVADPPPAEEVRWVAMGGTSQQIATSPDGVTWTSRTSPFTMAGRGVAYNGQRWVGVGQSEFMIATSDDGITWTGRASPFTTAGRGATWFHDQWVAVGQGGARIATSPDGATWTARSAPITGIAYGIAASDTLLVVGGQTGATLATSTDGVTWTARANPITGRVMGVAWNGAMWVAVGETGARIITSPDGILWTSRAAPISRVTGVAWNGEMWMAVGQGGATIATSADGFAWTAQAGSPFTTEANGVAWDGDQWVVVGYGGARIATSSDGVSWTVRAAPFNGQVWGVASHVPLYPPWGDAVDEPVPTSVSVTGGGTIQRGETGQVTAVILDQHRRPMEGVEFEWRTNQPCRVAIDPEGVYTGRSVGSAIITAWVSSSVRSNTTVTVAEISGEPPPSFTGTWEACDEQNGNQLLMLELGHEAGTEAITGTVTDLEFEQTWDIGIARWFNDRMEIQWSVDMGGTHRESFIVGGTVLDDYVVQGRYTDGVRVTTRDVRLIRVDD